MKHLCRLLLAVTAIFTSALQAESIRMPLYEVYPVEAIDLRCIDARYDVQLPIPERWRVTQGKLNFSYVNSASLLKKNSQLVVRLNGTPLAQIKLDPNAPEGNVEVDLPSLILQPGYNTLSFQVSQHYAEQCELPCVPELWTRIKLDQAVLSLDYEEKPVPLSISSVANFLFDAKNITQPKVNIISQKDNEKIMSLGGVIASGVALRYDYRPVQFFAESELRQGTDNILLGTVDYVNSFLSQYDIQIDADKPHIEILPLPDLKLIDDQQVVVKDPSKALLVITGTDAKQLQIAVESFDILSIPFPDSSSMQVHEFKLPEIGMYTGKNMLAPGRKYPFSKLNFNTYTFRGFISGEKPIAFRVPPDFLIKPNQYVNVALNFAYGAGFRHDSVLNILLNGQYVSSIHLDNPRGALVSNYQLSLPTYLFKGGRNTLSFSPVLTPLVTENCSFIHAENLFLTLFESSSLTFPDMPHQIEMPRLDLMFVNGFPFTRWPDGYESMVYIAENDAKHIASAYNLMSILSQRNGYPLLGMQISNKIPANYNGELMMVGTLENLPVDYLQLAPLKFGELNRVPYPVYKGFEDKMALAFNTQKSSLDLNKGVLMQFESPHQAGRSVVMMAAKSPESLYQMSLAIQRSDVQAGIKHDLVLVDYINDSEQEAKTGNPWRYVVSSLQGGDNYITGKGGTISPVSSALSKHPLLYWGLLALVILLLVWLIRRLLHKQQQSRDTGQT